MLRKLTAHLTIVFAGMCFVLFVVDAIKGGAMSFINNDITKAFIAILSLLAILTSILSLTGYAHEQQLTLKLRRSRAPQPQMRRPDPRAMQRQYPARPSGAQPVRRPAAGAQTAQRVPANRNGGVR